MTGQGHRWTGLGAAFFGAALARVLGVPEVVAALVASVSTTMPDWIEIPIYRNGQRAGSLITHRTITHWPPLWFFAIAWGAQEQGLLGSAVIGAAVGSLAHILADCPNPMGIPWFLPNQRVKFGKKGLWRSGEHEPFLALTFATAGFVAWRLAGGSLY